MNEGNIMTLILGAGAGLAGAITFLFAIVMKQSEKHTDLSKEVGELKGKNEGITQLSSQVLQTVHEALNNEKDD